MDALFEFLVELFGELIVELLAHAIAWLVSLVVEHYDKNPISRKRLKTIIYIICFISCIVLLIISFIYAKTAYALLASIFISINIFILGLKLINKLYWDNKKSINIISIILTRLSRISFYVLMFVFLYTLKTTAAKATLISITSAIMLILLCIDIYRINKYLKNRNQEKYLY